MFPKDILWALEQENGISNEDFARINRQFETGIPFYWLSNGISELESYFRYTEAEFIEFRKIYKKSSDKKSNEIKIRRKELVNTCEKGLKL